MREKTRLLIEKINELKQSNPDIGTEEIAKGLNISVGMVAYYLKQHGGLKTETPTRSRKIVKTLMKSDGVLNFNGLMKKIEETLAYAKQLAEYQKQKAEELFL